MKRHSGPQIDIVREVECLMQRMHAAPMFQIDKKYYENLTPEKVDAILNELE